MFDIKMPKNVDIQKYLREYGDVLFFKFEKANFSTK